LKRLGTYGAVALGLVLAGSALWLMREQAEEGRLPPSAAPSSATQAAKSETARPVIPTFDIVRIGPGGDTVIAGRAAPGAEVVIYDGTVELGRARADNRGEWVFVPDKPLTPGTKRLNLAVIDKADPSKTLKSEADVVLVVPEAGKGGVVAVQLSPKGGVSKVMQRPGNAPGALPSIAAVDYDDQGRLGVSGSAEPGSTVVVYLDNVEVGRATADAQGDWRVQTDKSNLSDAEHVLRADMLTPAGAVAKRAEVGFKADRSGGAALAGSIVVVQPGNSLWRIARRIYGHGIAYTLIFEANRSQIRDPDLIYPGQTFKTPKTPGKP